MNFIQKGDHMNFTFEELHMIINEDGTYKTTMVFKGTTTKNEYGIITTEIPRLKIINFEAEACTKSE
jgi:hypothetical protein